MRRRCPTVFVSTPDSGRDITATSLRRSHATAAAATAANARHAHGTDAGHPCHPARPSHHAANTNAHAAPAAAAAAATASARRDGVAALVNDLDIALLHGDGFVARVELYAEHVLVLVADVAEVAFLHAPPDLHELPDEGVAAEELLAPFGAETEPSAERSTSLALGGVLQRVVADLRRPVPPDQGDAARRGREHAVVLAVLGGVDEDRSAGSHVVTTVDPLDRAHPPRALLSFLHPHAIASAHPLLVGVERGVPLSGPVQALHELGESGANDLPVAPQDFHSLSSHAHDDADCPCGQLHEVEQAVPAEVVHALRLPGHLLRRAPGMVEGESEGEVQGRNTHPHPHTHTHTREKDKNGRLLTGPW